MRTFRYSWYIFLSICSLASISVPSLVFAQPGESQEAGGVSPRAYAGRSADPGKLNKKFEYPNPAMSEGPFKEVKLIPVVVLASSPALDDSVITIIQRDLMYGDKISPTIVSAAESLNDPIDFSAMPRATYAVRLLAVSNGINVELYDVVSRTVRYSERFTVPVVPESRAAYIRDSLAYVLATNAAYTRAAMARNAFLRDSVYAKLHAKRPKSSRSSVLEAWIKDSIERAAYMERLTARATALMAEARQDTVDVNTALSSLLEYDAYVRDSVQREIRWALHGIADEIHFWITGERGIAQSRITYVQDGLLRIVDFDGANDRAITQSGRALSPAWHPDGHSIVFSDMNDGGTQIAEVDLYTGRTRVFNRTPRGMNITPAYTRDGKGIVYAHSRSGVNTELVLMNLMDSTAPVRSLISNPYDNLSPAPHPDGTRIAFISSRPRTPQIYSMNLDGSGERLETPVTTGKRSYRASPEWSPDGTTIVYEQQEGDFQVWAMDVATKRTRRLTTKGENESPTWAPNGRHIAFTSTRGGTKVLWILDTESGRARQLTTIPGARLAAWSPLIVTRRVVRH